jgi:hypothetical protein
MSSQQSPSPAQLVIWLNYELEGDADEVELTVADSMTVGQLRTYVFAANVFQLPFGAVEEDVLLGTDDVSRFRPFELTDKLVDLKSAQSRGFIVKTQKSESSRSERCSH